MRLMRSRLSLAALAASFVLGVPLAASAQSLKELYEAAHAYDATYLAAKALADSARYREEQSESLARPNAALSGNASHTQLDLPIIGSGSSNTAGASVNAKYPLFNKGNTATIEQARRNLIAAQADLETAEQDLIVRVAQAYFDVLTSQDALATVRTGKVAITEQLASAKRNFEVGTATITDTREAQARYDLAVAQEIAAENDLQTKHVALDTLVGRANVTPKLLPEPVTLPPPVPADQEAWVTSADGVHPQVRKARLGLEIAHLEIDKARALDLPTVDAIGSAGANNNRGLGVTLPGTSKSATIGVQLNWTLYSGGFNQARISETLALEDKARSDLETVRRGVAQGTRVAFLGVQSGLAQVKALEAAEGSSKLALEATQLGYKVGVRVNLDVLNAQTQLFTTQRDLAKARYDVLVGSMRLRQAAGQLAGGDIDAVNSLLAK